MPAKHDWLGLAGWLALVFAASGLGAFLTSVSVHDWYPTLRKPPWNPPAWVFGPVWTCLYCLMALAAWLVWRRAGFAGARWALGAFLIQLALNVAWSGLFFGRRSPLGGMIDIILLIIAIIATMALFRRFSPAACWLLTPYLLWTMYASTLNWAIWRMNG